MHGHNGGIFQTTKEQWRIPITGSWSHATYSYVQSVTAIDQITGKTFLFYFFTLSGQTCSYIYNNSEFGELTAQQPKTKILPFRDKSLLMPGRGPEEIFMNSKNFSWPLIFLTKSFYPPPPFWGNIFHSPPPLPPNSEFNDSKSVS